MLKELQYVRHVLLVFLFVVALILGIIKAFSTAQWIFVLGLFIALFITELMMYVYRPKRRGFQFDESGYSEFESLIEAPYGIIYYDKHLEILWENTYGERIFAGINNLSDISLDFSKRVRRTEESFEYRIQDTMYLFEHHAKTNTLYFQETSEMVKLERTSEKRKPMIGLISIDNYLDASDSLDEEEFADIRNTVTILLNTWAERYKLFYKPIRRGRYFFVGSTLALRQLEKEKFTILQTFKEQTAQKDVFLSLSIAISYGYDSYFELGEVADRELSNLLSRGGDQVVIKECGKDGRYIGGEGASAEKHTRTRAKVFAKALFSEINESSNVYIMGHRNPDLDSFASCITMYEIAQHFDTKAKILISEKGLANDVLAMYERYPKAMFTDHLESLEITDKTFLIIVDTQVQLRVAFPSVLERISHYAVIDHHRRGNNVIEQAALTYIDPGSSSTSELIMEFMEVEKLRLKLSELTATALLSGIITDTNFFRNRTSSYTFEMASILRKYGADIDVVTRMVREKEEDVKQKNAMVSRGTFVTSDIMISLNDEQSDTIVMSKAANEMLDIEGVEASLVLAYVNDHEVALSARSYGNVNVQLLTEHLGGGGHFRMAAAQFKDETIEVVYERVLEVLQREDIRTTNILVPNEKEAV